MRLLDIHRDEIGKVWVTWAMVGLTAIGYAIGWSAVHSMLVKRMGVEYLPYTYIGISLLGILGSSVYLSLADTMRRDRLLILFCAATGTVLAASRFLVSARPEGETGITTSLLLFFAAVFFAQGVGNAVLGTQIWTIINDLFRPSQGRRIYPILGTAGTVGGIAGGASIHTLANVLGTANLVLIWAACIFALIPLAMTLRARFGAELRGQRPGAAKAEAGEHRLKEGWRFFHSSPMAMTLGFVAVMFWVVGSVADFQYTRIMAATFKSEDQLAGYYGIYTIVINVSGLLVQAFFSGYLVRRMGVARGLVALPATIVGGLVLVAGWFTFWPGLVMRYAWDMVGMTIQGNSFQLAMNAIPADLRARIRGFIDGVLNPLGGVLGGVVIIVLHKVFDSSTASGWRDPVTIAGLALSLFWIIVVWRGSQHYMKLIAANLGSRDRRTAMDAIDCLEEPGNARALDLLRGVATAAEPEKRMAAARVWGGIGGPEAAAALALACDDLDDRVRLEALRGLKKAAGRNVLPPAVLPAVEQRLASDSNRAVRAEALRALMHNADRERLQQLKARWLRDAAPEVRAYVVEALGRADRDLKPLLVEQLDDGAVVVRASAIAALWSHDDLRPRLASLLGDLAGEAEPMAHASVLLAYHRTGATIEPGALARLLESTDPVARVLAGALVLRDSSDAAERSEALARVFAVLAEVELAERLRQELLPNVPDFHEDAADAIMLGVVDLPEPIRTHVAAVLADWYRILEMRLQTEPIA